MGCKSRTSRAGRFAGLVVLFLLTAAGVRAQVESQLSDRRVVVGSNITYTIFADHEQARDVSVSTPSFDAFTVVDGPNVRPISRVQSGRTQRAVEIEFTLRTRAPGRYVLSGVEIAVAGQPYVTDEHLVEVVPRAGAEAPFLARWSGPSEPLVVGQNAVFTLEIVNATEFLYPATVTVESPTGAIVEEVQGIGEIERRTVSSTTLFEIPLAVFMVTPTEPGTLTMQSARMRHAGSEVVAPPLSVPVTELPELVSSTGAVGAFDYRVEGIPTSVAIGQVFTVRQIIAGTGNLNFLSFPRFTARGFRQIQQEVESATVATSFGYRGEIVRISTLRAEAEGPYRFEGEPFVYFDPSRGSVDAVAPGVATPAVTAVREPSALPGLEQTIELFTPDEVVAVHRRIAYNDWTSYGWFVPGILFLLVARLWRRPKAASVLLIVVASLWFVDASADHLPLERIERGSAHYADGNLSMAIFEFEHALRRAPDSPGLLHNLSILYFKDGDTPRALYAAREAVRLAPRHPRIRTLPGAIEASVGIDRSIAPRHLVHPDVFFFLLVVAVNLLAILGGIPFRRAKGISLVAQLVLLILIVASIGGLGITASYFSEQLGVVRIEYDMRRIPERGADGWLVLPAGTAVEVLATQSGYVLVQTALGLQGWIPIEQVLWPENPMIELIRYRGFMPVGRSDGPEMA